MTVSLHPPYTPTILDIAREELREQYASAFTDSSTPSAAFAQWLNMKTPVMRVFVNALTGSPYNARLVIHEFVRGCDFVFRLDMLNNCAYPISFFCGAVREIYEHVLVIPPNITYARHDDRDPGILLIDRGTGPDFMSQDGLDTLGTLLLVQWAMRLDKRWPWSGAPVEQMLLRGFR